MLQELALDDADGVARDQRLAAAGRDAQADIRQIGQLRHRMEGLAGLDDEGGLGPVRVHQVEVLAQRVQGVLLVGFQG